MKINILLLLVFILGAGAWTYWQNHQSKPLFTEAVQIQPNMQDTVNDPYVDDITFDLLNGKTVQLYDYKGRVVVIHFWATWCAPCLVEFPKIIKMAKQTKDNVTIMAITTDSNKSDIDRFLKRLKTPLPDNFLVIRDSDKTISQDIFQTFRLPETYILKPDLSLHEKKIGAFDDWAAHDFIEKLNAL